MPLFRKVKFAPCLECVEQRLMADGDLLFAMGCAPSPPIMDAPPKTPDNLSPAGTPKVPDPTEILINPYSFPPATPTSSTSTTAPYTVAIAVYYDPYAPIMA